MGIVFVGIEGSYKSFEISLFQDGICLDTVCGDNVQASSQFLMYFQNILKKNSIQFSDLKFLAVDQGPGAFTSLRVIISTVNALAFAKKIPLLGVDGLDALAYESIEFFAKKKETITNAFLVALLYAYNGETYYGVYDLGKNSLSLVMPKGYKKIDQLLDDLNQKSEKISYIFTGNGASEYKDVILKKFHDCIVEPYGALKTASAKQIGKMGFVMWKSGKRGVDELKPLYLKEQTFAVKK